MADVATSASRKAVKGEIKKLLVTVPGVKSVYTNLPRLQNQFPAIVVTIEKQHEKTVTLGFPRRRHIKFNVSLYIQSIDQDPDEVASQERFDDLLDAIDSVLRANPDLNGTVLASAQDTIDTETFEPTIAGSGTGLVLRGLKTFDVTLEIMG